MTAPYTDYFYQRPWWKEIEDWTPPTPPVLPDPGLRRTPWWVDPSVSQSVQDPAFGQRPTMPGYPWWVDPPALRIFPTPAPQDPRSSIDPSEGAPENGLLSYLDKNEGDRRRSIRSALAGVGAASGVDEQVRKGFDQKDTSRHAPPERRLGRHSYRM